MLLSLNNNNVALDSQTLLQGHEHFIIASFIKHRNELNSVCNYLQLALRLTFLIIQQF